MIRLRVAVALLVALLPSGLAGQASVTGEEASCASPTAAGCAAEFYGNIGTFEEDSAALKLAQEKWWNFDANAKCRPLWLALFEDELMSGDGRTETTTGQSIGWNAGAHIVGGQAGEHLMMISRGQTERGAMVTIGHETGHHGEEGNHDVASHFQRGDEPERGEGRGMRPEDGADGS